MLTLAGRMGVDGPDGHERPRGLLYLTNRQLIFAALMEMQGQLVSTGISPILLADIEGIERSGDVLTIRLLDEQHGPYRLPFEALVDQETLRDAFYTQLVICHRAARAGSSSK
jgi:hypothetical protein